MTTYLNITSVYNTIKNGDILNYSYKNGYYSVALPPGVYKLEVWGAEGGYRTTRTYAGKGGYSSGVITLSQPNILYCFPGGSGMSYSYNTTTNIYSGGYNGGGYRYGYPGGGGGSDIRIGGTTYRERIIVAGGGGSDGAANKQGMYGGGQIGGSSSENYTAFSSTCGKGGNPLCSGSPDTTITSQTTSGLNANTDANYSGGFGFGGGGVYLNNGYGGAGGGGWYGGTGTIPDGSGDDDRGGGGGSGYVLTEQMAGAHPRYAAYVEYYLTDTQLIAGNQTITEPDGSSSTGHYGNGYVRITALRLGHSGFYGDIYVKQNGLWNKLTTYTSFQDIQTEKMIYLDDDILDTPAPSRSFTLTDENNNILTDENNNTLITIEEEI